MPIVQTEDVRHGGPRIEGTRITVLDVYICVCELGESQEATAEEYHITVPEVEEALEYYQTHEPEMEERREQRDELHDRLIRESGD